MEKAIQLELLLVNLTLHKGAHADHSNAWPTHQDPSAGRAELKEGEHFVWSSLPRKKGQ